MAKSGRITGEIKSGKHFIKVNLNLVSWYEDGIYYVFAPMLEVTGYGKTESEANESFTITLEETLTYMINKKTIFDEFERLGWMVNRKRLKVQAPSLDEVKETNEEVRNIYSIPGLRATQRSVELPLA
jgi:predicted RNase H-like HicB family nuclease